jgi:hypothetical protein
LLFAILVAAFAYWVWPTPWQRGELGEVRVHRHTGEVWVLMPEGWKSLAAEQLAAEQLAAEQLAAEQLAAEQLAAERREQMGRELDAAIAAEQREQWGRELDAAIAADKKRSAESGRSARRR